MRKKLMMIIFTLMAACAFAKAYPSKNINMVVPFSAGGGTDAVARKLGSLMEKELGTSVVIVNKTGGAGAVGMTFGATQKKDGYTITMITREIVSLPLMNLSPISYKDFALVSLVNMDPAVVLVEKDALAIENEAGVKFNHIPYNGAGEVIPALLGKHADFSLMGPGEAIGQLKAGQLRALGFMADTRIESLPEVATLKELGHDVVSGTWRGIAVPKGTSPEIVAALDAAIKKSVESDDFKDFMNNSTFGIKYLNGKDFETFIIEDTATIDSIVKSLK